MKIGNAIESIFYHPLRSHKINGYQFNIIIKKNDKTAEILAHYKSKKVGQVELLKDNNNWNLNKFYVDSLYNNCNILTNKLLNKINELNNEAKTDNAIIDIISYFEKD